MNRDGLLTAAQSNNVQAFLRVIREGESGQNTDAYTVMFGGDHFESFADHPRQKHTRGQWTSTAAGAYQFLARTWDGLVKQYGFPDFSPVNQDLGAIALIAGRKALDLVLAGRIREAIDRCSPEWASLPGSTYGQPTQKLSKALEIYALYGGSLAPAGDAVPATPQEVKPMAPLVVPILSMLTSLIPQLGSLFGGGSEVAQRNVAAAGVVAKAITEATQSVNLQEAAEKIQNDPQALSAAKEAVALVWPSIDGSGAGEARKAAADPNQIPILKNPAFLMALCFMPLVYAVVLGALLKFPWLADVTPETRGMVIGFVMGTIAAAIVMYFFGSSSNSQKKDSTIAVLGAK